MVSIRLGWLTAAVSALCVAGCGSSSGDGTHGATSIAPSGSVSCGTLTCSGTQTCLVSQSLRPFSEGPSTYSCITTPTGCGGFELCDCPATQGELDGKPVTGCSLLGERSLYVTDVTCGDRNCNDNEYCLVKATTSQCFPLPEACAATMCSADCKSQIAAQQNVTVSGCLKADYARAVQASG
ncbi:MAG: hypothetical protein QM756_02440 [Polyangiaceae bacterium]